MVICRDIEKHSLPSIAFHNSVCRFPALTTTMSGTCGNCDCSDKSQCVKKGSSYVDVVETEKCQVEMMVAEMTENDGKCKCGANCTCTNCTCGH